MWTSWHHRLHKELKAKADLIPSKSCLLIALSGGQDSMALTQLIKDLNKLYEWEINVWHGDHQWHKNSGVFAKEINDWCRKKNLPFFSNKADLNEVNSEEKARNWRYKCIKNTASKLLENKNFQNKLIVLTGHNSSDRSETLIMNLARGCDLAGLSTMKEERKLTDNIQLVRPLMCFTRSDTKLICKDLNLPIWLDPSNESMEYKRNIIRSKIMPLLEDLNIGCSKRISAMSERISLYENSQSELTIMALKNIAKLNHINRNEFLKVSHSTRIILLNKWLELQSAPRISSILIDNIVNKISRKGYNSSIEIKNNWKIEWDNNLIFLKKLTYKSNL